MKFGPMDATDKFGRFPNNMKYADGTYAEAFWMAKEL